MSGKKDKKMRQVVRKQARIDGKIFYDNLYEWIESLPLKRRVQFALAVMFKRVRVK